MTKTTCSTPGPWKLTDLADVYANRPTAEAPNAIQYIARQVRGFDESNCIANARLMAAAPDLAKSLRCALDILERLDYQFSANDHDAANMALMRAALALVDDDSRPVQS